MGAGPRAVRGGASNMATTAPPQTVTELPPDTRGPTAPLPATIYWLGVTGLTAALGGTALVQIVYAIKGAPLTPECLAEGLQHYVPPKTPGGIGSGMKG